VKTALVLFALVAAPAAGALGFVYSGFADIAATTPHWAVTRWLLSTAMERSVQRRAQGVAPPADLDQESRVREGARAYDAMCAGCHGAPGVEPDVVGKGLYPEPPDLAKASDEWTTGELFWITSHGIRMTGMPAFGPTHSDAELWEVVALVKRLPRLSGAEYQVLSSQQAGAAPPHQHSHEHHHPRAR
jgi:mono/diheme cytochrome c family protein